VTAPASRGDAGTPAASAPARASAPAGLARRLGALLYESLLVTALVLVLGFATLPLVSPGAARPGAALAVPPLPARVMLFTVVFAVLAAYFVWSWSGGRATLAQKTWRLRLADERGAPLALRTALARYLAAWVGPALAIVAYLLLAPHGLGAYAVWVVALNFVWALIDRDRRFLHDRLAGTRLLRVERGA
jgi:uncharacterized RDD family membrane protein YckC